MTDQEIIQLLFDTGHLRHPFGERVELPRDMAQQPLTHSVVERAMASYHDFNSVCLEPLCIKHHGRPARANGVYGPATAELLELPRCGCPDYGKEVHPHNVQAAIGTGSWAGCHGVGDFHAATVFVDDKYMTPSWRAEFDEIWALSAAAYAEIGLRWTRTDDRKAANTVLSFERNPRGWIGLAIVGSNQSCGSQIWLKLAASYAPRDSIPMRTKVTMHEKGHNAGMGHSRGGVMNAYVMDGVPATWKGDPSESILKRYYGGKPVGVPEPPTPVPPVPPIPPPPTGRLTLNINWPLGEDGGGIIEVTLPDGTTQVSDMIPRAT